MSSDVIRGPVFGGDHDCATALDATHQLDKPGCRVPVSNRHVLVGCRRDDATDMTLGGLAAPPEQRLWGTAATVAAAVLGGAHIVRVHDVAEMAQVVKLADAIRRAK